MAERVRKAVQAYLTREAAGTHAHCLTDRRHFEPVAAALSLELLP